MPADTATASAPIRQVRTFPVAIPLREDYAWRYGAQTGVNVVVVALENAEGVVGYGEISCDHQAAAVALGEMMGSEYFLGRCPGDVERIITDVWRHGRWSQTPRFTSHVLAGLETACWDLRGKELGVPASTFFGGRVMECVDFFGYVQGPSAERLARAASELVALGYSTLYMKVGRERLADDVECVAAVRDAIGSDARLRVDANEAWPVAEAVRRIRALEEWDLDWVEQPVRSDDVPGLARVRNETETRIAADQAVYTPGELRTVLSHAAADVVVVGQHETGGLWRLRQMAFLAEVHGVEVNRHGCFETDLSTAAAMQVLPCIPNLTCGNQLMHTLLEFTILETPQFDVVDGKIKADEAPGLGITLNMDAVAQAEERYHRVGPFPPSGSAGGSATQRERPQR